MCLAGRCFKPETICDGDADIRSNMLIDEMYCEEYQCSQGYWKCEDDMECIPSDDVCDGTVDCYDASDEHVKFCGFDQFLFVDCY